MSPFVSAYSLLKTVNRNRNVTQCSLNAYLKNWRAEWRANESNFAETAHSQVVDDLQCFFLRLVTFWQYLCADVLKAGEAGSTLHDAVLQKVEIDAEDVVVAYGRWW